jgi:hypothetical protein
MQSPAIARERYVSLTTYKRDGNPVHVPVWIADLGDGTVGFTTDSSSFKVKRIRNNPNVVLRPCSIRGRVKPDEAETHGTAAVVEGSDHARVWGLIRKKYRIGATLIGFTSAVSRALKRSKPADCGVVITLAEQSAAD